MEWELLTRRPPSSSQRRDIEWGWNTALSLKPFGVVRSIHVKNRTVLAVETQEGLADAIGRSGRISRGGFSVLLCYDRSAGDVLFPDEPVDRRILQALIDARASCLALDADYPVCGEERLVKLADQQKIALLRIRRD